MNWSWNGCGDGGVQGTGSGGGQGSVDEGNGTSSSYAGENDAT